MANNNESLPAPISLTLEEAQQVGGGGLSVYTLLREINGDFIINGLKAEYIRNLTPFSKQNSFEQTAATLNAGVV